MKIPFNSPPVPQQPKCDRFPFRLGYLATVLQQQGPEIQVTEVNAVIRSQLEVKEKIRK